MTRLNEEERRRWLAEKVAALPADPEPQDPLQYTITDAPGALRWEMDGGDWAPANPALDLHVMDIGPATVAEIDLAATLMDYTDSQGKTRPSGLYLIGGALMRGASASIELTIEDIDGLVATLTRIKEDAIANRGFAQRADGLWTNGRENE